jgi:endoglucanase
VRACLLERLVDLPHLTTRLDEFGNLHAVYDHQGGEPFRLVAHMDHPGFVVENGWLHFAGGVDEKYFAGKRIVFHHEKSREPLGRGLIRSVDFSGEQKLVRLEGEIPSGATFARWALPGARCTKRLFLSPACDDLVQVAVMLALLRRLALSGAKAHVHALFTRAEEIGFAGALAALKAQPPPKPMTTLSLEASPARGFAKVEGGPIVRVGDRLSVFDSGVTHWLETAFRAFSGQKSGVPHQRLLMGGGTCEGSVFLRTGWPTGALCVALDNYHNMGPGTAIRSESISLRDWQNLYDFLFFLATAAPSPQSVEAQVAERFDRLESRALAALNAAPLSH